jgi:hypothetical protein
MKRSMAQCKRRLASLWFAGAGTIFFVVFLQTVFGYYGERNSEVWSWLLPTVMPTLSLSIGVLVIDALGKGISIPRIDEFLYRLTFGLSSAYLFAVLLLFLLQPLTSVPALQVLQQANLWLGPFQGLVAAGMGAFFATAPENQNVDPPIVTTPLPPGKIP